MDTAGGIKGGNMTQTINKTLTFEEFVKWKPENKHYELSVKTSLLFNIDVNKNGTNFE
ncbi:MAG: hypothetical protein AAF757_29145 [Cyanobacteria bacterium P01_D01_bin.116]